MSPLPSARASIEEAERAAIPYSSREDGYRRQAQNHQRAAEAAAATPTATNARKAEWHVSQAEALLAEADGHRVDLRQAVQLQSPGEPPSSSDTPDLRSDRRRAADTQIERSVHDGLLHQDGAEKIVRLMEHGPIKSQDIATRWAAATSDPAYVRAFGKIMANSTKGHLMWTPEESRAYQAAEECRGWLEATPSAAGYLVPLVLDHSVLLTSAGVRSPIRSVARVETVTTGSWTGISSASSTAEWVAEAVEVAQMTPTIGVPHVDTHKLSVFVKASYELTGDGRGVVEALQTIMADSANTEMENKYALGDGVGQPEGVVVGLSGVAASVIASCTSEIVSKGDPVLLQNNLGPRFQPTASYLANLTVLNQLTVMEVSAGGSLSFPDLDNGRLLRRPINEMSTLESYDAAVTDVNYPLLYGSWKHAFLIADQIGSTVSTIPVLFGANQRPTAEAGFWLLLRTGSGVIVPEAGRALRVTTTA